MVPFSVRGNSVFVPGSAGEIKSCHSLPVSGGYARQRGVGYWCGTPCATGK